METKSFNLSGTTEKLPIIYLFINGENSFGVLPVALAEDGTGLAGHCSSTVGYARHDIGFTSDWKHEKYKEHYPNGYTLVWLEQSEVETNDGISAAFAKNAAMAPDVEAE